MLARIDYAHWQAEVPMGMSADTAGQIEETQGALADQCLNLLEIHGLLSVLLVR